MEDLKAPELDKAKLAERMLEGLIADEIVIAVAHGFDCRKSLKDLSPI